MEFIREGVARSATAITAWAATLNHELRNNAVKVYSIIKIPRFFLASGFVREFLGALCKSDEIGNCLGCLLIQQTYYDIPLRCFKNCVCSCFASHSVLLNCFTLDATRHIVVGL